MDVVNYALSNKIKKYVDESVGNVPDEKITEAVNTYLDENPVTPGATAEQAEQIQDNTNKITELKSDLTKKVTSVYNIVPVAKWEDGTLDHRGDIYYKEGYARTTDFISVFANSTLDIIVGDNAVFIFEYGADKTFISNDSTIGGEKYVENGTHTLTQQTCFIKIVMRKEPVDSYVYVNNSSVTGAFLKTFLIEADVSDIEADVSDIEADVSDAVHMADEHFYTLCDSICKKFDGYIVSTTGEVVYSSDYYNTDFINVSDKQHLIMHVPILKVGTTKAGIAFYNQNKEYISGVSFNVNPTGGTETRCIDVPTDTAYMRTCFRKSEQSKFFVKVDDVYINSKYISELKKSASYTDSFGMQMFEKIGVISDSISCGWALDKNGNRSRRNLGISWVQQMARRLGCTAYNLGASGVDPIEWFQSDYEFSEHCYTQYQNTEECDLYIIGLGLNGGTLGSVADIKTDYTQNGNTFYGQYARIIQMINAEHPNAIVMCVTEPTTAINNYDTAVRTICGLDNINAILVDLETDYFDLFNTAEIIAQKQPDGLHYTPYGYSLLANAMLTALNDYISKNSDLFKYVGVATV